MKKVTIEVVETKTYLVEIPEKILKKEEGDFSYEGPKEIWEEINVQYSLKEERKETWTRSYIVVR